MEAVKQKTNLIQEILMQEVGDELILRLLTAERWSAERWYGPPKFLPLKSPRLVVMLRGGQRWPLREPVYRPMMSLARWLMREGEYHLMSLARWSMREGEYHPMMSLTRQLHRRMPAFVPPLILSDLFRSKLEFQVSASSVTGLDEATL